MAPVEEEETAALVEVEVEEEAGELGLEEEEDKIQAEDVPFKCTIISIIVTLADTTSTQITQVIHTTHRQ